MQIQLNGEPYQLDGPLSVAALLDRLQINPLLVAVEHNQIIIRRPQHMNAMIQEGS